MNVIAIDGPAASGKSSVARALAHHLKYNYMDSGSIYRAITFLRLSSSKIQFEDLKFGLELLPPVEKKKFPVPESRLYYFHNEKKVYLQSSDLTSSEVTSMVPSVANDFVLRSKLLPKLRELPKPLIMDGRDIGTKIFPDAKYKFYLDASVEVRAKRRMEQFLQQQQNNQISLKEREALLKKYIESISLRDQMDKQRVNSPLKMASDALLIRTDDFTFEQNVECLLSHIEKQK